jgi:hypothetical protein
LLSDDKVKEKYLFSRWEEEMWQSKHNAMSHAWLRTKIVLECCNTWKCSYQDESLAVFLFIQQWWKTVWCVAGYTVVSLWALLETKAWEIDWSLRKNRSIDCLQIHRRPVCPLPKFPGILEAMSEYKNMICCRKIRNATSKCNALNFLCTTRSNLEMCLKRRKFSNA